MKALNEYVYGVIQAAVDSQALSDNVYYSFLPSDWSRDNDSIVYETEIQESFSTLHDDNYAQSVRLRIKVVSKDSAQIYELSDQIKEIVLLAENSDLRDIQFVRNNYLFDERLDVHSFSNDFDIYLSKSAIERITIGGGFSKVITEEKIFSGTDNYIILSQKIELDQIIAITLSGLTQSLSNYSVDNSGATSIIIMEDPASNLDGLRIKVIYLESNTEYVASLDISTVEGIFNGSTNQIDLSVKVDDIILTAVDGTVYRRALYTIDNTGATTVITLSDSAASLNGRPYHVIFFN